jgi:alcohol dehydrogenase
MRAWRVNADFTRELVDLPIPEPAKSGVVVRMRSAPVLSYLREVIEGSMGYLLPPAPFTPGTNGIGPDGRWMASSRSRKYRIQ